MTLPSSAPDGFRPTQCRHPVRLVRIDAGPEPGERRLDAVSTACKSWRCPGCGRELRQLHGQLIEAAFAEHIGRRRELFARFVTVTLPTDTGARLDSAADCANVTRMFRLWVEDVRRHYAPRLEYYVVKEPTLIGRLHLHALTFGAYLPKCSARRLPPGCVMGCAGRCARPGCHQAGGCIAEGRRPCVQALAWRRGLGFLDLRAVRGQRHAAAYIGKYLGKDHIGHPWPRHSRRVSYSRDFAPTTIGQLAAAWSARAFAAGVAAGHLHPREPSPPGWETTWHLIGDLIRGPPVAWLGWLPGRGWLMDLDAGTVRHLGSTRTADVDTGEVIEPPASALSLVGWLRRQGRRIGEEAEAIAGPTWETDLTDPATRRLVLREARRRVNVSVHGFDPEALFPGPAPFTVTFPERPLGTPYTGDPAAPFE